MSSEKSTDRSSKGGGGTASLTPSTALLVRRLGASPTPRMLTQSEIELLRASKREMSRWEDEAPASRDDTSGSGQA